MGILTSGTAHARATSKVHKKTSDPPQIFNEDVYNVDVEELDEVPACGVFTRVFLVDELDETAHETAFAWEEGGDIPMAIIWDDRLWVANHGANGQTWRAVYTEVKPYPMVSRDVVVEVGADSQESAIKKHEWHLANPQKKRGTTLQQAKFNRLMGENAHLIDSKGENID